MDILTFSKEVENRMREKLNALNAQSETQGLSQAGLAAKRMSIAGDAINELRHFVNKYKFSGIDEEIKFFKELKPVFVSQYLYYKQVYSIQLVDPYMEKGEKQEYLGSILKGMLRYTRRNSAFHQYTLSGDATKDEAFYIRSSMRLDPMKDQLFTTSRSETLAIILSHDLIREHLIEALRKLNTESTSQSKLTWTGKKAELIELLFALQASGVINNAKADVKQIAIALEHTFNITLGNYYDYLNTIRSRKKTTAVFIESLREKLIAKLSQMDED